MAVYTNNIQINFSKKELDGDLKEAYNFNKQEMMNSTQKLNKIIIFNLICNFYNTLHQLIL